MAGDLHCSDGRVSSMPGSSHAFPEGTMCDQHPERPAVARIQGETDSFGAEFFLACDECRAEHRRHREEEFNSLQFCDWCKTEQKHVREHRDYEEGMAGPIYMVCGECRRKENERLTAELEEQGYYNGWDDWDDYDGPEDRIEQCDSSAPAAGVPTVSEGVKR
jgi:hypothetical protein